MKGGFYMKKIYSSLSLFLVFVISLYGCSAVHQYKRINLKAEMLGGESEISEMIQSTTDVENYSINSYSDKMPVYKITPREISSDEFQEFADSLGFTAEMTMNNKNLPRFQQGQSGVSEKTLSMPNNNSISYLIGYGDEEPLGFTDEELKSKAQTIFNSLPLIEGEYEYLGISSTQTLLLENEEFVVQKRVSFRRLIDGIRVIGNDICDLYFNSTGLSGIQLTFYDYEKTGELDMLTLDDAVAKVKEPDAFILESETNQNFSGAADKLTIERTKLLFVNQYSDGCEILQPVYNLMGTAENAGGSVEFSARIIAIPEKYTHD